jgi:hypothetical protein
MGSPSVIAPLGHSGSQAPQAEQSLVMKWAMIAPYCFEIGFYRIKITHF